MTHIQRAGNAHRSGSLTLLSSVCALTVAILATTAEAETVTVQTEDLLGGECMRSWGTLRVSVTNRSGRAQEGTLVAEGRRAGGHELRQPLTIQAGATAGVQVSAPPQWCQLRFCFVPDSGTRRCASYGAAWPPNRGSQQAELLIVQESLELRPVFSIVSNGAGEDRSVPAALALVERSQQERRRLGLPERAAGYSHFQRVVFEAGLLGELNERQRRALRGWVRTGGQLIVVASEGTQFPNSSLLTELVPNLRGETGRARESFSEDLTTRYEPGHELEAQGRHRSRLLTSDAPGLHPAAYGTRAAAGLGVVHFVEAPPEVELAGALTERRGQLVAGASRQALDQLIQYNNILSDSLWQAPDLNLAALGQLDGAYSAPDSRQEHRAAQALALDANHSDRIPIWVYVLIVALCTAALFVFQQRWSKSGKGVARLILPVAATTLAACFLVFGLSSAARGVGNRYRSMAWIEVASGEQEGGIWRRLALALDSPGRHELEVDPTLAIVARGATSQMQSGARTMWVDGGRWQTLLAAEQGTLDLRGAVHIEWGADGKPSAVRNELPVTIEGASLQFGSERYALGNLEPGASLGLSERHVRIPAELPMFLPESVTRRETFQSRNNAALVGTIDFECPTRGDFRGEACSTSLIVWGAP